MIEFIFSNKVHLAVEVSNQGTHKQFLSHVKTTLYTIKQRRLLAANDKACKKDNETKQKLTVATKSAGIWMKILTRKSIAKGN